MTELLDTTGFANNRDDVTTAMELAEEINELICELPEAGEDFGMSVAERASEIARTVEERMEATSSQIEALENMLEGVKKWIRD